MIVAYLSGPITGIKDYKDRFAKAEAKCLNVVDQTINPAKTPLRDDWEWLDYIITDLSMMREATVMVQLPGWKDSRGVMMERLMAFCLGIPIVMLDEIEEYVQSLG